MIELKWVLDWFKTNLDFSLRICAIVRQNCMLWIGYLSLVKFRLAIVFIMDESYWWKIENNFTLFTDHFECSYENDLYYGWKNLNSFLKSYMTILYTVFIT